ncbi:MAG: FKBP-type peptidyl-prolyl cis-trans isomerase [Bacteroidota bacterium]
MKQYLLFHLILLSVIGLAPQQGISQSSLEDYLRDHSIDAQRSEDGVYYHFDVQGQGPQAKIGDYLMVRYKGMLLDSTVFDETDPMEPFVFQLGYRQVIRGWDLSLSLFQVGSQGTLYVPAHLAYGQRGVGSTIPPNSPLMFEIELLEIMDIAAYDRYMVDLERREREHYEEHIQEQFTKDKKLIQEYALDHKIKAKRTASGLSYALTKKGKGPKAQEGDQLVVQYEGRLIDDRIFDQTKGKKTYTFTLGKGKVIPGWEEGLLHFKRGSEGWLLIPSKLAYGPMAIEEDNIFVPGDAVLVFKIKVLDIQSGVAKN